MSVNIRELRRMGDRQVSFAARLKDFFFPDLTPKKLVRNARKPEVRARIRLLREMLRNS